MKVMICIGSSCHIKGSRQVVELMQKAVREHHLEEQVELGGTFCLGNCQQGVCVQVDDVRHTGINGETFPSFFETEILAKCRAAGIPQVTGTFGGLQVNLMIGVHLLMLDNTGLGK